MSLSHRVQQLSPSPTLAITAKAKELRSQGYDVISLGAGEPDFNTPDHIIEAAYKAMKDGLTKYTAAAGIQELREAICRKLEEDNQLHYSPNQVVVCTGAKHALYNIFQTIINPGDEVLIPVPYWVTYPEQVKLAGGVPVFIEGREENGFKVQPEQIEQAITEKTKAIVINSPNNPTGNVYSKSELSRLAEVIVSHDLFIISDEIYEKLIYDDAEHVSIASLGREVFDRTFVVNGVSKPYSMTGWRIGYVAGATTYIKAMADLSSQSVSNSTTIAQYAALAAISGPQETLHNMKAEFKRRRDTTYSLLCQLPGLTCLEPKGAFYLFPNVKEAVENSPYDSADAWAEALLEEEKVAIIPGSSFGSPDNIRISYATSLDLLEAGMARIKRFLER